MRLARVIEEGVVLRKVDGLLCDRAGVEVLDRRLDGSFAAARGVLQTRVDCAFEGARPVGILEQRAVDWWATILEVDGGRCCPLCRIAVRYFRNVVTERP